MLWNKNPYNFYYYRTFSHSFAALLIFYRYLCCYEYY